MKKNKGFTLLTSIVVTSILLLVSFVVANISLKQLLLSYAGQESQHAFYNADSGLECAMFWDSRTPYSSFATSSPPGSGSINCNGQNTTGRSTSINGTFPLETSRIGGGTDTDPTSKFSVNYVHGCAIVSVTKTYIGVSPNRIMNTLIESKGYNTCDTNSDRRFERGIKIQYTD